MTKLIYEENTYKIIGACIEVHKELGCGFLEGIYQEALEIEFENLGISYDREKELLVYYKDKKLKKTYKADFICYNHILLELKALNYIISEHESQIINYLKATNLRVGLLINFGEKSLKYKRFIL
jgi:GxxExxY protein